MGHSEITFLQGQGKALQVISVFPGEASLSPFGRGFGVGVEVMGVDFANGCPVVVAGYGDVIVVPEEVDDFGGIGAVADDVSEGPQLVHRATGVGVGEDGVEGLEVGVNVGED